MCSLLTNRGEDMLASPTQTKIECETYSFTVPHCTALYCTGGAAGEVSGFMKRCVCLG